MSVRSGQTSGLTGKPIGGPRLQRFSRGNAAVGRQPIPNPRVNNGNNSKVQNVRANHSGNTVGTHTPSISAGSSISRLSHARARVAHKNSRPQAIAIPIAAGRSVGEHSLLTTSASQSEGTDSHVAISEQEAANSHTAGDEDTQSISTRLSDADSRDSKSTADQLALQRRNRELVAARVADRAKGVKTLRDYIWDEGTGETSTLYKKMQAERAKKRRMTVTERAAGRNADATPEEADASSQHIGPQIQIVNGQIVVSQDSLYATTEEQRIHDGEFREIDETAGQHITANSFKKSDLARKWSAAETHAFFKALRVCGTNFSMIQKLFPGRSRKQIKSKFMREERARPQLVNAALKCSVSMTYDDFNRLTKEGALYENMNNSDV